MSIQDYKTASDDLRQQVDPDFLAFLADLPPGVSTVRDAARLASDMADGLTRK